MAGTQAISKNLIMQLGQGKPLPARDTYDISINDGESEENQMTI